MWKATIRTGLPTLLALIQCVSLSAEGQGTAAPRLDDERWQLRRLHHPTQAELARESQGSVFIYENFTDRSVDHAMDTHFERIQSMMFVGTIVTGEGGEELVDPATGQAVTEEDGCD